MAGTLKSNVQLGDSATATQNFTLTAAAADGTMKLARGNAGGTTQDILTVDALGGVKFPQNVVVFSATGSGQSIAASVGTTLALSSATFDVGASLTLATGQFKPTVAGYYQINANVYFSSANGAGIGELRLRKSAGIITYGSVIIGAVSNWASCGVTLYLNGSTDYVDLAAFQSTAAALGVTCNFSGSLIVRA